MEQIWVLKRIALVHRKGYREGVEAHRAIERLLEKFRQEILKT